MTGPSTTTAPRLDAALRVVAGRAELDRTWWSWAGPQGGLVAGLMLNAAVPHLGVGRSPRSLHAVFLEPATAGPLDLEVTVVREGGSSAVVAVAAGTAARATVVGGRRRGEAALTAAPPPAVPRPEECADTPLPADFVPFSQHLRFRFATEARPFAAGRRAELVAWVRPVGDVPVDAAGLVVLLDAMPPALYAVASAPVAVPTVDLTVTLAEVAPTDGWLLTRITTLSAEGGWCVDDSEVWDGEGRLLARGRQTRRVLGELS